jgi:hypothetical protein
MKPDVEKPKYNCKSRNTIAKAEIHLENAEIHLQIVQMNLQWIENDESNLKKNFSSFHPKRSKNLNTRSR